MNIIVLKNNIKEALSIMSGLKKDGTNIPILKNFLLEASDGKLKLSSTDLEIGITYNISSKVIENGSSVIPFSMFSQIINNLLFERINIETKDNLLSLKTDNYSAKISTYLKNDFPIIPKINEKEKKEFIFLKDDLIEALSSVVSSCKVSDIKPELSGILFSYNIDSIKFVTTDSFRLSEKTISSKKIETKYNDKLSNIIPLKTIQEVIRIFSLSQLKDKKIKISFDSSQVSFEDENTYFVSKIIEGKFPDYEDIILKEFSTEAIVEKEDLSNALKLSSSLSNKLNEVKFINEKNSNNIKVCSLNKEVGESEYILQANIKGDPVKITFNWRFILDGIKPISSKDVFIGFNGEDKPTLLKSIQDSSFLYIVMPIKSI